MAGVTLSSAFSFADEMRVGLLGMVRRVWGKRGVKVRQRLQIAYEWRYLFLAVDSQAGRLYWCWLPALTAIDIRSAIRGLQPFGLAALVWDRAAAHHDQGVRALGLPLVEQPPASPELNPAERVFEELRRAVEGKVYATIEDKVAAVGAELERLEADPDRVRRLTGWDWITAAAPNATTSRSACSATPAVMTGWQNNYHLDGREMGGPGVSLPVWVKNPGGWQLAAAQVTRLQK